MLPNDFWKTIMRDGVGNFYCVIVSPDNSFTSKTKECANFSPYSKELWECGRLLLSIDEPTTITVMNLEIVMNFDTEKRTGGKVLGNKVLEYGGDFDYTS